jgi:putative addiction module component (TIGR02574 family)
LGGAKLSEASGSGAPFLKGSPPELARLSPRQRLDLIESLWESLDEKDVPVTDGQRAELDRRIVGFDQDGAESIPWDQLRADLRQQR